MASWSLLLTDYNLSEANTSARVGKRQAEAK